MTSASLNRVAFSQGRSRVVGVQDLNDVVAISASSALTCISCLTISTRVTIVVGVGTYIKRYCSDSVFLESERERKREREREERGRRESV